MCDVAAKFPNSLLRTECVCQVSFAYETSSNLTLKLSQGKFTAGLGKRTENLKMKFEWGPWISYLPDVNVLTYLYLLVETTGIGPPLKKRLFPVQRVARMMAAHFDLARYVGNILAVSRSFSSSPPPPPPIMIYIIFVTREEN